jgi:Protein of unknown function (DUF1460)
MKFRILASLKMIVSLALFLSTTDLTASVLITDKDKSILQNKLEKFATQSNLPTATLFLAVGLDFLGTPYVAKTLDRTIEENLVVNLREFDCTTFVESTLAITLTLKSGHPTLANFLEQLQKIRYRDGSLNGYASRLHYFSEWMTNNQAKSIVTDISALLGGIKDPLDLNFMGNHPDFYPQLKDNPTLISQIKLIEKNISAHNYSSIPKDQLGIHEEQLLNGDIVALTTRIQGLDVSHLGIVFKKEGQAYLLNASSVIGSVTVTPKTLVEYLNGSKNVTGIFVLRVN